VPAGKKFRPVLLVDFGISSHQHDGSGQNTDSLPANTSPKAQVANSTPDYFTSIKDAAAYAGKTERTILNWKSRRWLKVEQDGKKIRIAKTELDKCITKQ
jgi:hypothetical protein